MGQHEIDEILELIWTAREQGKCGLVDIFPEGWGEGEDDTLREMTAAALITIQQGNIQLLKEGERRGMDIIRRHRLAETLFSEVFDLEGAPMESGACNFEHILSPKVIESVCTFLGHPRRCPHGKPIPPAECCNKFQRNVQPLVMRLCDLAIGEEGRIVFITPKHHARLDRLSALGLIPGSVVKLHQRQPAYVISLGETDMALDKEITREIYVKKI